MGSEVGQPDTALATQPLPDYMRQRPQDFSFFQAVRLLQRLAGIPEPVGSFQHPQSESVRLRTHASLSFPPSEIHSLEEKQDAPPEMTVNFFGLTGPLGVLPTRYTELMLERLYARDTTLRDFLDIFNHRMISLLYRAWERYRYPVTYERQRQNAFTGYLLDLIGLGLPSLQNRQAVPDQALLGYQGLFAQYPRSAMGFRNILSHYFQIPVAVEPFAGTWRPLDLQSRTQFNEGRSHSEQLGVGIVLGDEVWDQQSVVRIRLGPMTLDQFKDFLPDGSAHAPLKALSRFYCGDDLDVEAQLVLKREEAPRFTLGAEDLPPPRLGWVSWMFTRTLDRDPDETVLRLWDQ